MNVEAVGPQKKPESWHVLPRCEKLNSHPLKLLPLSKLSSVGICSWKAAHANVPYLQRWDVRPKAFCSQKAEALLLFPPFWPSQSQALLLRLHTKSKGPAP